MMFRVFNILAEKIQEIHNQIAIFVTKVIYWQSNPHFDISFLAAFLREQKFNFLARKVYFSLL